MIRTNVHFCYFLDFTIFSYVSGRSVTSEGGTSPARLSPRARCQADSGGADLPVFLSGGQKYGKKTGKIAVIHPRLQALVGKVVFVPVALHHIADPLFPRVIGKKPFPRIHRYVGIISAGEGKKAEPLAPPEKDNAFRR